MALTVKHLYDAVCTQCDENLFKVEFRKIVV